jgi:uncharacterized protein YjdB
MKKITVSILTTLLMLSMVFSSSVFAAEKEVSAWDAFLGLFSGNATTTATEAVGVEYRGHIQNVGNYPLDGTWIQGPTRLGTVGQSLRLEGFWIQLTNKPADVNIEYEVHVQNVGWMAPVDNGDFAGTEGKSQQIEAIKIRLVKDNGEAVTDYSVNYRGHVQNIGDTAWYTNGQQLGTDGQFLRLEALEVEIVKNPADLAAYNAAKAAVAQADYTAASWTAYQAVVAANVVTTDNLQSEVDAATAAITAAQANLVLVPKVTSVTAINGTSVAVTFSTAIDKNTIDEGDFSFVELDTFAGVDNIVTGVLDGKLSTDGKTYTLTTNDGASVFRGRYDVKVVADAFRSTANVGIAKYTATLTFADTTAPKVTKVKATPVDATHADVVLTYDEQIGDAGTLNVNGQSLDTGVIAADNLTALFANVAIDEDTAYTGVLVGAADIAGNIAGSQNISITATADTTLPTVTVTAKNTILSLKFSEEIDPATVAVAIGAFDLDPLTLTLDDTDTTDTTYTIDALPALTDLDVTFINNAKVVVSLYEDLAGNVGKIKTTYLNLKADTTAPVLTSKELVDNQLVLKFDEAVVEGTGVTVAANLALSFVDADGVITPLTAATWDIVMGVEDDMATPVIGKDLNNNGWIDANSDEEKYVVIAFTDADGQIIGTDGNLVDGDYTFSWAKGLFVDASANQVAAAKFTLSPSTSSSTTADVIYSAAISNVETPINSHILVSYTDGTDPIEMSADALIVSNYKLAGAALPTGTTAAFYGDKTQVLITLPQGSITANGVRTLVATNVTSTLGHTINTDDQGTVTVALVENVLPTFKSMAIDTNTQATATFSETLTDTALDGVAGVTVKVNGTEVTTAHLQVVSGKLVITGLADLTDDSKVTLVFSSTDLQDLNGNVVADN